MNSQLAFEVFRRKVHEEPNANICLPPVCLMNSLLVLKEGSSESSGIGDYIGDSDAIRKFLCTVFRHPNFTIANAIFSRKGICLHDAFVKELQTAYRMSFIQQMDFTRDQDKINHWIHQNTFGKINTLKLDLHAHLSLVFVNAVYFSANWLTPFLKSNTYTGTFTNSTGQFVSVPLMTQQDKMNYMENNLCQAIQLFYTDFDTNLMVILPKEGCFEELELQLCYRYVQSLCPQFRQTKVDLTLPRFDVTCETELKYILEEIGMDLNHLTKMCQTSQGVDQFVQKVLLKVDEQGTEAAAVGSMGTMCTDGRPPREMEFQATRPFFYCITDRYAQYTYFIGCVKTLP